MTHADESARSERSLLDEIDELDVLEAEELQEGVAFHAFRFSASMDLESIVMTVRDDAATLVSALTLPHGATLMEVRDDTMRIMFDPKEVSADAVQSAVKKSLGKSLVDLQHPSTKYKIATSRPRK